MKRDQKYQNTNVFKFVNVNPKKRITGDCVIRALCVALNEPYEKVYRELFEYSVSSGYMVNDKKCYERWLTSKGWKKHSQPRKEDNTKYTGREFCKEIQEYTFNYPDRIFAHIGGHHVVAIVDGRICDIWDSSNKCIGNYWTKD